MLFRSKRDGATMQKTRIKDLMVFEGLGKKKVDEVPCGEIYYADLSPVVGSEQGGVRPVLIIQNDTGNRYSPTVIAAAITSQTGKARLPTHIDLPVDQSCGLSRDSIVLLEQVRTLDKKRLRERLGHVEEHVMTKVDTAIAVSFGLPHDQLV